MKSCANGRSENRVAVRPGLVDVVQALSLGNGVNHSLGEVGHSVGQLHQVGANVVQSAQLSELGVSRSSKTEETASFARLTAGTAARRLS